MLTAATIRRAQAEDIDAVIALRDEAAAWLLQRGIRQWQPGEVRPEQIREWLASGRVYVAEWPGRAGLVGSVRLAWDDVPVWGRQPPEAGYLQALVTARSSAGHGLGGLLLGHAEGVIARSGRPLARLSHLRDSPGLTDFYRSLGYREVGSRQFPDQPGWDPVTLVEKRVS